MYLEVRKNKNGTKQYRFTYKGENGKRVRFPQSKIPKFKSKEEAEAWGNSQDGISEARKAYRAAKLAWKTKYYQFTELLEKYAQWQSSHAPNSYKMNCSYLENYAFVFFLNTKHLGNINDWHIYFQEFQDWLRTHKRDKPLSASTINNIIKALNTFLTCLVQYNLIDRDSAKKCQTLPEHMLNRRSFKDLILEDEMKQVHQQLITINPAAADFFYVLWNTGMRFSELFGLPITALFKGNVPNASLEAELKKCAISYVGYIYLDSQPYHDDRRREKDYSLKRKPLKSHKEIGPKSARIIPIRTKEVWNILATRYKAGLEDLVAKKHTINKEDYVFFEDLEWNKVTNSLRQAYANLGKPAKQYHCCRHTFTTLLVGETRSFFLTRTITGHRKDKSFERYLHVFEQMALDAKQQTQDIDVI